jgi:hypothetical protein
MSSASHLILFSLTHSNDIKAVKAVYKDYVPPSEKHDKHGFYFKHTDGEAVWRYYKHEQDWWKTVKLDYDS